MVRCENCNTDSVGLYCTNCATRKVHKSAPRAPAALGALHSISNEVTAGAEPVTPQLPPITWSEVLRASLDFLAGKGLVVEEQQDGLDWLIGGQRLHIETAVVHDEILSVTLHTNIATFLSLEGGGTADLSAHWRAAGVADYLNSKTPVGAFVAADNDLQFRLRLNLSPTGRTLLPVLRAAVLLHAYYAEAARKLCQPHEESGVLVIPRERRARKGESTTSESLLSELLVSDDTWLVQQWPTIRPHLTHTMMELGYPPGWSNHEVQFFNQVPPDIAVAVLEPEAGKFAPLGRGVVLQARISPPVPDPAALPVSMANFLNLAMFDTGLSVLGGFSTRNAELVGMMVDLWVPIAGAVDPAQSAQTNGISLANLAVHAAGAPFATLESFTES